MRFKSGIVSAVVIFSLAASHTANAAELKVLSAGVMKEVILALVPEYEKKTGNKVVVDVAPAGTLAKRIEAGEAFDVAVITRPVIDSLVEKGKIRSGSRADLACVGVGVAIKEGAPRPDISTPNAFKRTVLAAKSVAHTDPAAGATSGIYLVKLFEKLGIADQVKQKATLVPGGSSAVLVARGEVELAVQQTSEIMNVPGTTYVGPLPAEIQNITIYVAGIGANARDADAAKAFIGLLTGPEAARLLKPHGLEPVVAR
jgi:molybdate transport system substrate-binding protein